MPQTYVSPAVAHLLGPEQANRLSTGPAFGMGSCVDCHRPVDVHGEDASILVLLSPADMIEQIHLMAIAHARCSVSEVRAMTRAEAEALLAASEDASVSAVASLWPNEPVGTPARPTLFVSFHAELSTRAESGERVDVFAAHFLSGGWDLIATMELEPTARPTDTACRVTVYPVPAPSGRRHFRLELLEGNSVIADIESLEAHPKWLPLAREAGTVNVYVGPLFVQHWTEGIDRAVADRAVRAGSVVGATVPIHVFDAAEQLTYDSSPAGMEHDR